MEISSENVFKSGWNNTELGKRFCNLGFHMFTIDQHLSQYEDSGDSVIRMTLGKSDRPLTDRVKQAMKRALDNPADILRVDSEGNGKLRAQIAEYYANRFECSFPASNIIVGSQGTSSLYRDIFLILLQDGGQVLLPKPGYILYEASAHLAQALCGNRVEISYYQIDTTNNRLNMESLRRNFQQDKTRIVVVNSPGNPTGNILSSEEYSAFIDVLNMGQRVVLICDQVYSNIVFDAKSYPSILDKELNQQIHFPFIVTDSMSKGFEMYTFRVGYAMVPPDLIEPLTAFQRNFSLTPVTISQFGAIAALQQEKEVRELAKVYEQRNKYACAKLSAARNIRMLQSEGGFYFLIDCRDWIRKHELKDDLQLALHIADCTNPHVGAAPGSDFGAPGYLRISFSPRDFEKGIDLLVDYFEERL